MQEVRQITVRFPSGVWAEVDALSQSEGGRPYNDVIVDLVAGELRRRHRALLLARIAAHRSETAGTGAVTADSTSIVRGLREGARSDE